MRTRVALLVWAVSVSCTPFKSEDPPPDTADGGGPKVTGTQPTYELKVVVPTDKPTIVQGGKLKLTVTLQRSPDLKESHALTKVSATSDGGITASQVDVAFDQDKVDLELAADLATKQ